MSSITDTVVSVVGARTSPVTTSSDENIQRGSSAATVTQEKCGGGGDGGGGGGGGGGSGGAVVAGSDGSCIRPLVQSPAATTPVSSSSNNNSSNNSSNSSSSSSVTTTTMACSDVATASSCVTAEVPLPTRKEGSPQSQNNGCSSPRGSVGEHSILNVMESGGCEPQSSACTPVCDVTHVIDAKQQCAEPSVSSSGGPRPCLKS